MRTPVRLFVAIVPPPEVTALLVASAQRLGESWPLPPHRVIDAVQVHMTLAFIGDTDPKNVVDVRESVDRSCSGVRPFTLTASRLVTIPTVDDGGPARLVAAVTDSPPGLLEVQRRLAQRLTKPKRNGRRGRFLPHLTLVRYQHGVSSGAIDVPLKGCAAWGVDSCTMFSSVLTAGGSVYTPVHTARLG